MRAFFAALKVECASLLRSKAAAMLWIACAAWALALPRLVRGDGTAESAFALDMRYTLGTAFALALVAMSAAAAGTLARDREAKRLQLSMVRPSRTAVLALARMAAASACGSVAIAVVCIVLAARCGVSQPCDHAYGPILEDPMAAARRLYDEYSARDPSFRAQAEKAGEYQTLRYLAEYAKTKLQTIPPGESAQWTFPVAPEADDVLGVKVKFIDAFARPGATPGVFRCAGRQAETDSTSKTETRIALEPLPGMETAAAGRQTVLSFTNAGKNALTLSPRNDLRLLSRGDGFGANLLRGWLVLSAVLSTAVSFCVFLGACFGRSVAVFCAMGFLILSVSAPATVEDSLDPLSSTASERMGMSLAVFAEKAVSPLNSFHPVEALESRECVEWSDVARAAAAGYVLHPFLFALLSGLAMRAKRDA